MPGAVILEIFNSQFLPEDLKKIPFLSIEFCAEKSSEAEEFALKTFF